MNCGLGEAMKVPSVHALGRLIVYEELIDFVVLRILVQILEQVQIEIVFLLLLLHFVRMKSVAIDRTLSPIEVHTAVQVLLGFVSLLVHVYVIEEARVVLAVLVLPLFARVPLLPAILAAHMADEVAKLGE